MDRPETVTVDSDVLIVGGGMAGCGAAYEAAGAAREKGLRAVVVEKAAMERSGAVGMGLATIDCFLGTKWDENTPEDFVRFVRNDLMGLSREDLVYDIARHVDASVHMFEEWGLPFVKTPEGRYAREGRWQVRIEGHSYKPIIAEAAKKAVGDGNVFERVYISHLLADKRESNRIAGAIGFGVREPKIYVFKARAVVCASGGATNIWRPRRLSEGLGRYWYSAFNSGSVYKLLLMAGAEISQMEHRLVQTRFKDGYGPVGMWFLLSRNEEVRNAFGERFEEIYKDELENWRPYSNGQDVPTPVRNFQMMHDIFAGKGPFYMKPSVPFQRLYKAQSPEMIESLEGERWGEFLDIMTKEQALRWASQDVDDAENPGRRCISRTPISWGRTPPAAAPGSAAPRTSRPRSTSGATTG